MAKSCCVASTGAGECWPAAGVCCCKGAGVCCCEGGNAEEWVTAEGSREASTLEEWGKAGCWRTAPCCVAPAAVQRRAAGAEGQWAMRVMCARRAAGGEWWYVAGAR
eukprot:scaffold212351_cov19-Tisochrysis_lutea.AAC.1